MAQGDQVQNLVNNLTTAAPSGSPQLNSMSDLLGLTGPNSALANGGGAGGEFDFSPDELRDLIKEWKGLRDAIVQASETAQRIVLVQAPARDPASERFAKAARDSGHAYLKHNEDMQNFATAYINKLQDTLDSYTNTEQANADHARHIQNRQG